jgi:hypothetical protein
MNFGPVEFAAYLRRKGVGTAESAKVRAAHDAAPPRTVANRLTIVSGPREMRRVARDPDAVPVHVFEAIATRTDAIADGDPITVAVRSPHFVVLVLSSHQDVTWQIEPTAGTRLAAVLLAGRGLSQVRGAGDAPVSSIGGFYAFRRTSGEFRHLEDQVRRLTGQGVARFHSEYAATGFEAFFD